MTRVDFYILPEQAARNERQILCSLTDKAWKQGHRVYIHVAHAESCNELDELLWTFRDVSFVPHGQLGQVDPEQTPVLIGHEDPPEELHDIMINMTDSLPLFFGRFDRLIEIVDPSSERRQKARERYRFYKERGYTLNTHNLDA